MKQIDGFFYGRMKDNDSLLLSRLHARLGMLPVAMAEETHDVKQEARLGRCDSRCSTTGGLLSSPVQDCIADISRVS
jgi:hypothetical protein